MAFEVPNEAEGGTPSEPSVSSTFAGQADPKAHPGPGRGSSGPSVAVNDLRAKRGA
jgi:hypothetical protein